MIMNLTRRYFLKTSGALALYCGISPARALAEVGWNQNLVRPVRAGKTLVVIFLRGGMDGLNFIVPFADPGYYKLRKRLAIAEPGKEEGALALDDTFGLHPRAAVLLPLFQSGQATALQAVGYAHNTRSHFEEQDVWETGVIGNTIQSDGWLNRHLLTSEGRGPIRAVSLGDTLPRILRGRAPAVAMRGLEDLSLAASTPTEEAAMTAALEHAYCTEPGPERSAALDLLAQSAQITLEGTRQLREIIQTPYTPVAEYPNTNLGRQMREAARLIKADLGVEVIEVDFGGWDTHQNQGSVQGGFGNLVQTLTEALAAFTKDLENRMDDVLVLTLSDFGRTAAENGTGGTDHGWANCMLVLGGPVLRANHGKARPIAGQWPGLAKEQLHQGRDLFHTTDFRDVLGEVVSVHLGNSQLKAVLPGHTFKSVNVVG
ncbi:MAG: DUF1501 domain-containing protein [Candidatus Methylacidiphilales bacterium]